MKLKGIFLDLDGTLTHFNIDYMSARKAALRQVTKYDVKDQDLTEHLSVYAMLKRMKTQLSEESYLAVRTEVYEILRQVEDKAAEEAVMMPSAKSVVGELKKMGLRTALVTNNSRKATLRTLGRHSLVNDFEVIVTRDDCPQIKPDPETLLTAVNVLRLAPGETAYVGDTVIDIQAARKAGIVMISVPTGPVPLRVLLDEGPDFLISDLSELPNLIQTQMS